MTKLAREIIGRTAVGVLGLGLLFGAYKCFGAARDIAGDNTMRQTSRSREQRTSGAGLPVGLGVVLTLLGAPLALAAVVPVSVMEKLLGRQRNNTLWKNPEAGEHIGRWGDFL